MTPVSGTLRTLREERFAVAVLLAGQADDLADAIMRLESQLEDHCAQLEVRRAPGVDQALLAATSAIDGIFAAESEHPWNEGLESPEDVTRSWDALGQLPGFAVAQGQGNSKP